MKTAVIYARFSCSKQREASIEDQLRVCEAWCASEGYAVVARYCDSAISGRTDDRPEFQRMIANAGESEIVLVYMMDRFSRDAYDAPFYKKHLKDAGVKVVSATESIPDGPDAILLEKIYEGLAAVESAHISARTKRGMEGNALKCRHNGVRVFGYSFTDDGGYAVDEDEAEIVRYCFERKACGDSVRSIAKSIAKRGVTTYAGNPANHTFVNHMLKNEKYLGIYIWGNVRVEGGMPQIIERDDFMAANNAVPKKRRKEEDWGSFPLSGKSVCAACGYNAVGVSGHGNNGVKYEYYRCSKKCGVKPIRADALEDGITERLRTMLSDRETVMKIAEMVDVAIDDGTTERRKKQAEARKAKAEQAVKNLKRAVAQGMDYDLVKDDLAEYYGMIDAAERDAALYATVPDFDREDFASFLQFGATLDDKNLLDAFVYQVQIGEDDVTVVLNYGESKDEAARFLLERVRLDSHTGQENSRTAESSGDSAVRTNEVWLPQLTVCEPTLRSRYSQTSRFS